MHQAVALFDTDTLRAMEASAVATAGEGVLMQRAGEAAWRHLLDTWPDAQRILVVCGPGNNGGDGYALATHAITSGRHVDLIRMSEPRTTDATAACHAFLAAGGHCQLFDGSLPATDVLVDALFGIGLARAPDAAASKLIEAINAHAVAVLALDVPSGVDADSGHVPGLAVRAHATVQFIAAHRGLATGAALDHCGDRVVARIGVGSDGFAPSAIALQRDALRRWLKPRRPDSHKGSFGHVLCIGGDVGHGGAVMLCCDAALRSGAGLVGVATRPAHVSPLLARRPEAMVVGIDEADTVGDLIKSASVIAIGPGLGTNKWGRALLEQALGAGKPLVIDADGLNLLVGTGKSLPGDTILTPHPGEAARLLGVDTHAVQVDRYASAAALVQRFGAVVVLKGAGTIIAAPGQTACVIDAGNPGMAVGGMGDLLTGVVAALRAQGLGAFDAACCGALLHAVAGDVAAQDGGQRGLLPSDLLDRIRRLSNPPVTS